MPSSVETKAEDTSRKYGTKQDQQDGTSSNLSLAVQLPFFVLSILPESLLRAVPIPNSVWRAAIAFLQPVPKRALTPEGPSEFRVRVGRSASAFIRAFQGQRPQTTLSFTRLPEPLQCEVFSFLTVQEHFTILAGLSKSTGCLLLQRLAWPPELAIKEDSQGRIRLGTHGLGRHGSHVFEDVTARIGRALPDQVLERLEWLGEVKTTIGRSLPDHLHARLQRLGLGIFGEPQTVSKGVVPRHILRFLRRLCFQKLSGCGPTSLALFANPLTTKLRCENLTITEEVLAPLSIMQSLKDVVLRECVEAKFSALDENVEILMARLPTELIKLHVTVVRLLVDYAWNPELVFVVCPRFSPADLASLVPSSLPLTELHLVSRSLSDECFEFIGRFPRLKKLTICSPESSITGQGLTFLSNCPTLEELHLVSVDRFQFSKLAELRGLPLKSLFFEVSSMRGADLEAISASGLPIETLQLSNVSWSDVDLSVLRRLPVGSLYFVECPGMSGVGVAELAASALPVVTLAIIDTEVSDADLLMLQALPALCFLHLRGCQAVTPAGIAALKAVVQPRALTVMLENQYVN
eukprot:gb/GEZN01003712.1/.p1 GENE.gb/GEZN01003712.1/~~gb/GEZN01003712.1/.p1  ORF type:complete len:579 (+),score=86.38 gb/GEZN01003712.1/:27-1763(+)